MRSSDRYWSGKGCGKDRIEMPKGMKGRISFRTKIRRTAAVQCAVLTAALIIEIVFAHGLDIGGGIPEQNTGERMQEESRKSVSEEKSDISNLQDEEEPGETEAIQYVSKLGAPEGIVDPAKIVWEEVPAELTEEEFVFGGLRVALPEQSTWEYQEREDGTSCACLSSTEKLFEKIYFTHYKVKWNNKWELILAALEYFSGDEEEVVWFSVTDSEEIGVYGRTEHGKSFYMLVFDEELYLLEEERAGNFSFEDLSGEGRLKSDDIGGSIYINMRDGIRRSGKEKAVYLLKESRYKDDRIVVYQGGNFEKPVQVLDGDNIVIEDDINFDGYLDISKREVGESGREYLLWSGADGQFVKADVPTDGYWTGKINEEFQTIWVYDDTYGIEEITEETEKIYIWEGVALKEIRNIVCRIEEEEVVVTLTDTESGKCLASGTFEKRGWENDPGVRKLYEQFYDGYAPKELYCVGHDAPGEEELIPESLVETLSQALLEGTQDELRKSLETGRELSEGEMVEAGLKSADISRVLEGFEDSHFGRVRMWQADLDNDGHEDIFSEEYGGGSGGFTDYILYQGREDGEYVRTGRGSSDVRWQHTIIGWEGKNYVCRDGVDYGKRILSGLVIEGYRDGELTETIRLNLMPEKQEVAVTFCQDGWQETAEKERMAAPAFHEQADNHVVVGNAERKSENSEGETVFFSDIDNDGVEESYIKRIWLASSMNSVDGLEFGMEESAERKTLERVFSDGSDKWDIWRPMMLWVDTHNGKNIVHVMYRTDLYDYIVEGYLLGENGNYSNLYTIEGKTELSVGKVRAWEILRKRWRMP